MNYLSSCQIPYNGECFVCIPRESGDELEDGIMCWNFGKCKWLRSHQTKVSIFPFLIVSYFKMVNINFTVFIHTRQKDELTVQKIDHLHINLLVSTIKEWLALWANLQVVLSTNKSKKFHKIGMVIFHSTFVPII